MGHQRALVIRTRARRIRAGSLIQRARPRRRDGESTGGGVARSSAYRLTEESGLVEDIRTRRDVMGRLEEELLSVELDAHWTHSRRCPCTL